MPVFVVSRADGHCGFPVVPPNQAVLFCYLPTVGNSLCLLLIRCVLQGMAQFAGLQVCLYCPVETRPFSQRQQKTSSNEQQPLEYGEPQKEVSRSQLCLC